MLRPLSDVEILTQFTEESEAWVLKSRRGESYLTIPDYKSPGRRPIRFFLAEGDAKAMLIMLLERSPRLADAQLYVVKVKLLASIRSLLAAPTPGHADSFVVHTSDEVRAVLQAWCHSDATASVQ